MNVKCWNVDIAMSVFVEALDKADRASLSAMQREDIIMTAVDEIRNKLTPELRADFIAEADEMIEAFPIVQASVADYKRALNGDFILETWKDNRSKLFEEETDIDKLNRKERVKLDFLMSKFKDSGSRTSAARAMLYFLRNAKLKLMETFIVDRDKGFLVTDRDIVSNVKHLKQSLLNTVVDYLKELGYTDEALGDTTLFDASGMFQHILDPETPLYLAITEHLDLGVRITANNIKNHYEDFRAKRGNWQHSKRFIDAYNAKTLLFNFDTLTSMLVGSIVKPENQNNDYDRLSNENYVTKFSRATNMWGNGLGDEVENIADLVSFVTQMLIQTSKRYNWKSSEPIEDLYLAFLDFNYIITKVKKLARLGVSKQIVFDSNFFREAANRLTHISTETQRSLDVIREMKRKQGYAKTDPTLENLLSFVSDNPLRHLHAIFDLLCNTNVITKGLNFDTNDKNLIWTVGKELFGSWPTTTDADGNPRYSRSLYDLHQKSHNDRIFEIVTLIADSMFADEFLQYYEDQEGTLKVRVLLDYAVSQIKAELMHKMKQTHGGYNPTGFAKYVEKYKINLIKKDPDTVYPGEAKTKAWLIDNPEYTPGSGKKAKIYYRGKFLKEIEVPIGNFLKIQCIEGKYLDLKPGDNLYTRDVKSIWESKELRDFIKDTIGINFSVDVELANAYEELFRGTDGTISYRSLLNDILRICGETVYNLAFNNNIVPTILKEAGKERNEKNVTLLRNVQYKGQDIPRIDSETGTIEMIPIGQRDAYLEKLGIAHASITGILTAAQVKTGEGTALAALCLHCLRSSHAYQIVTQNRNLGSPTRDLTYVNNDNGFFLGIMGRREFKSDATTRVITDMSSVEAFTASFLGGFVGAFCASDSSTINKNGRAFIIPAVYSDKSKLDELAINLNAIATHGGKRYRDMTDAELDSELCAEFGNMYDGIVKNVNAENLKFAQKLGINTAAILTEAHPIEVYRNTLAQISDKLCSLDSVFNIAIDKGKDLGKFIQEQHSLGKTNEEIEALILENEDLREALGKIRKSETIKLLHLLMSAYNKTHRRKPIEMCEHVHYLFNSDGILVPNDTLIALWGRFKGNETLNKKLGITDLYPEGHKAASTAQGYFKYEKDLRSAYELLNDGFEVYLRGSLAKLKLPEIKFLAETYPEWITESGKMAIAKIFVPDTKYSAGDIFFRYEKATKILSVTKAAQGVVYNILEETNGKPEFKLVNDSYLDIKRTDSVVRYKPIPLESRKGTWQITQNAQKVKLLASAEETRDMVLVHPMLSKLNRIYYLAAQQYTCSVGGAHYVYKGKGKNILEEEANRWLTSNKRNVSYASPVHKYQNKTLNGVPKFYLLGTVEDIKSVIYSIMGDIASHKPIDGGTYVNPWFPILENNSLGGEAAGLDKKQFGTYYYEKYAAGGILKTAGFAITNQRMRRSKAYLNLCKNMTERTWIKEFSAQDGTDIEEFLDITRDYKGNVLNWIQDENGSGTFYERDTNGGRGRGRFKLAKIEAIYTNGSEEQAFEGPVPTGWMPTNRYRIYEYPISLNGEINRNHPDIAALLLDPNGDIMPIQRLDGANENGEFEINSNWKLFNIVFGGMDSMSMGKGGNLEYSENSILQMVHALNNIGYTRTSDNNDDNFGDERYTTEFIDEVKDLDDLWQPLKYSDVSYAPNIGALKSTQMNVNPAEAMYEDLSAKGEYMNAMQIMMANLGIQLDKEHHADESEVSMPTQIISACANKGYTIHYADKLYKSLSTLTELCISDCMDGIMELMPGNENRGKLLTEIANIIVDKLIHTKDDASALYAAMEFLVKKVEAGKKLTSEDVVGNVAWSDSDIYNKIYSDLASHFTNNAIKMKAAGSLAVICPTEVMEQIYGDLRLDSYSSVEDNLSVEAGLEREQEKIRTTPNNKLIFDAEAQQGLSVQDRANLAANLDTLHHYWIEWNYEDGSPVLNPDGTRFRENITIDEPSKYYKLKNWLCAGGKNGEIHIGEQSVPRRGMVVAKIYENITKGRELGAFNARFEVEEESDSGAKLRFCIFDLDSVKAMFAYNDLEETYDNALKLLNDRKFIAPIREDAEAYILRFLQNKAPEAYALFETIQKNSPEASFEEIVDFLRDLPKFINDFVKATFKICKVLTYKAMEKDLFKISKDYDGPRLLWVDGRLLTVNPKTIQTQAYELIMPKIYQTKYGLKAQDQVWEILLDPEFFSKRAIERVRQQNVAENCFHYELKAFNGNHVYIWDSRLGEPNPEIFREKTFHKSETEAGTWEREDIEGNFMHGLSSGKDRIMHVGNLGLEIIVTDNPEYYFLELRYNLAIFSDLTVNEEMLLGLTDALKGTKSKQALRFLRNVTLRGGKLKSFKNLRARNDAVRNLTLEFQEKEPAEITKMRKQFLKEGAELHTSFDKSLDIIAGRIPAQSQQSFMPLRVVAFDNNDINTAYVSTFQLFLLGSDLDIDAVNLIGSEFDANGKYVMWSPLADISNKENLEASLELPFPTGLETTVEINDKKDSFFVTYNDYIKELFEKVTDTTELKDGTTLIFDAKGEDGFNLLRLKSFNVSPEKAKYSEEVYRQNKLEAADRLRLLAQFIEDVNTNGFNIKGKRKSDDSWRSSEALQEEWENRHYLDEEHGQETSNALKRLGFTSPEAAYSALQQIKAIIDEHNNYINSTDRSTREQMTKNMVLYAMFAVCSTPSNLVELMVGVDVVTDPIKNLSSCNGDDKETAPGNYYTVHRSFQEGLIGKLCVGIGAVSIKVNSASLYYMDRVLCEGTEEEKERLLLPKRGKNGKRGYVINGVRRLGLLNIYDKSAEDAPEKLVELSSGLKKVRTFLENIEIIELLDSLQTPDDITPNVAMSLAAMLSVAVDNAKDLALAKINAGPKMFGFYAYGISLGMDIRELASIINTPQGRAISKLCEGNALNGQMGAFSALLAIKKLEGNIGKDLRQYDVLGKADFEDVETNEIIEKQAGAVLTRPRADGKGVEKAELISASQLLEFLMLDFFVKEVLEDPKVKEAFKFLPDPKNDKPELTNMVFLIALSGKMDKFIDTIKNPLLSPNFALALEQANEFNNSEDWKASIYQLLEYCQNYGNLVKTYYRITFPNLSSDGKMHKYYLDLKILALGAEEMRILGTLLGSNKGIKSHVAEGITFIETIENAIISRKEITGSKVSPEDKIDFTLFCLDSKYRLDAIRKYEAVKHTINILDVLDKVPHMLSYVRTYAIPYAAFTVGSAKFRARNKYYDYLVGLLLAVTSALKENIVKGIENAANAEFLKGWLAEEQMQFLLPKGSKLFVGRNVEPITTTKDLYIPLIDKDGNGLATFKYYMENTVIPDLLNNPDYSSNSFVQNLRPFELTKTGTHASVTAYSSGINMIPKDESQEVAFQTCQADFSAMYDFGFPGGKTTLYNTPASYADAFYIYSLYVFNGKRGPNSLMSLFGNGDSELAKRFKAYVANIDLNDDLDLDPFELMEWCASNDNFYNPATKYFYATPPNTFGRLYMTAAVSLEEMENEDQTSRPGPRQVHTALSGENRGVFINPLSTNNSLVESQYKLGINDNVVEPGNDLQDVVIDEATEEMFSIVKNPYSLEYSVVPSGELSERSLKILSLLRSKLPNAFRNVYDGASGNIIKTIDSTHVKALLVESINKVDENC